jgi:molybdenum cofactor cytidylyltransferase
MISAIILAAGESKRMGRPKMLLSWDRSTVLQTVITTFQAAGIKDIIVVTGGSRNQVDLLIGQTVQTVYNENYLQGEMLSSIQPGIRFKMRESQAVLIALGDQPQVQVSTIQHILQEYKQTNSSLIVPSYNMRRGHPWLIAQDLWDDLLKTKPPETAREFLSRHTNDIQYIVMDTPTVLQDLDTPEDYLKSHSGSLPQNL